MSDQIIKDQGGAINIVWDADKNLWVAQLPNSEIMTVGKGVTTAAAQANLLRQFTGAPSAGMNLAPPVGLANQPAPLRIGSGVIRAIASASGVDGCPACIVIYGIDENNPDAQPMIETYYSASGNETLPCMNPVDMNTALESLRDHMANGDILVSWGAVRYDLKQMAAHGADALLASEIAMNHFDLSFQVLAVKGFLMPFTTALAGMEIGYDPSTRDAVENAWGVNPGGAIDEAISNCAAVITLWQQIRYNRHTLNWTTRSGKQQRTPLGTVRTVADSMKLPEQDTSWMKDPITRADILAWIQYA